MRKRNYVIFDDDVYALLEEGLRELNPLQLRFDDPVVDISMSVIVKRRVFGGTQLMLVVTVEEHDKDPDPPTREPTRRKWYTWPWMSPREA